VFVRTNQKKETRDNIARSRRGHSC